MFPFCVLCLTKPFVPPPALDIALKKKKKKAYVRQNFIFSETYVCQNWKALNLISITVDKYSADEQQKALGEGGLAIESGRLPEPPSIIWKKFCVGLKTSR